MPSASSQEKSLRFHLIGILISVGIGVIIGTLYINANVPASFTSPSFIANHFIRMVRETAWEEGLGAVVFTPKEPRRYNSVGHVKKRASMTPNQLDMFWHKSVSGSTPLVFSYTKSISLETPHSTQEASSFMNAGVCTTPGIIMPWSNVDAANELNKLIIQEHSHFKSLLTPLGQVEQSVICTAPTPVSDTKINELKDDSGKNIELRDVSSSSQIYTNLIQLMSEEYVCNVANPQGATPVVHFIMVDPYYSDYMLPHEGGNRLNSKLVQNLYESHFRTVWNRYPTLVKKENERRKKERRAKKAKKNQEEWDENNPMEDPDFIPSADETAYPMETNSNYNALPDSKHAVLKAGDCIFLPAHWWLYAEIENSTESAKPLLLTRSQYKAHSAMMEVFVGTARDLLKSSE